ncbi:MAG: hypothetical protein PF508_15575 [Spirochaeta sp.]|nr:hypothetical protein [Spirochaeta sp.]
MELVIFHYHLLPGGVTGVIEQMAAAINTFVDTVDRVRVVTSSQPENLSLPSSVPLELMPTIGYISRQRLAEYAEQPASQPGASAPHDEIPAPGPVGQVSTEAVAAGAEVLATRIADELLQRFGGTERIWWVHKHHIGKNPAFTRALLQVAATHPNQRIVFHIHDFPECSRYANLRFLEAAGVGEMYPRRPNVHYAVINSRDRDILVEAGVGPVTYLPNPVQSAGPSGPADRSGTPLLRTTLAERYGTEFPRYAPEDRLFLYPVRSIRRKNVFEAALITMLQDVPASLVVTLPGVSQQEKRYSAMVAEAFRDGTIPGLFGIGTTIAEHGISFEELQRSADAIISSSVQEGFGYQYISPLVLGLPLVARQLDIMGDIIGLYRRHPHALYNAIRVPDRSPSLSGPAALLRFRYEERIDRLQGTVPDDAIDELYRQLERSIGGDTLEFSYLLPHMQYVLLQDLRRDPAFLTEVQTLNGTLLAEINSALETPVTETAPVKEQFGPRAHASVVERVIAELNADAPAPESPRDRHGATPEPANEPPRTESPREAILRRFATLEYQRLLYE